MVVRIRHKEASERLDFNNPRQTECCLGAENQSIPCVSKRRDFKHAPIAGIHKIFCQFEKYQYLCTQKSMKYPPQKKPTGQKVTTCGARNRNPRRPDDRAL